MSDKRTHISIKGGTIRARNLAMGTDARAGDGSAGELPADALAELLKLVDEIEHRARASNEPAAARVAEASAALGRDASAGRERKQGVVERLKQIAEAATSLGTLGDLAVKAFELAKNLKG